MATQGPVLKTARTFSGWLIGAAILFIVLGAFAIIGSAAFLASSMKMPLTAIALIVEFTRIGHDFLIPISLAVAGSVCVFYLCTEFSFQPFWRRGSAATA